MKLIINVKDWVKCQFVGLTDEDRNTLYDKLRVFVPSSRFTPQYKIGAWDGYINYFQLTGISYTNLIPMIEQLVDLKKYDIEVNYADCVKRYSNIEFDNIDENYFGDRVWYEGHRLAGQPIKLEDHQVRAINTCLDNPRCIIEAATGAGKTVISQVLCEKVVELGGNAVLVVPKKDLALQTADEFRKLGLDTGVVGCGLKEFGHKVTVATWQTINSIEKRKTVDSLSFDDLNKMKENLLCLICDEVHEYKANQVSKVLTSTFKDIPIRWGLTGTVPKDKCDKYSLITSIGPVCAKVESKELQDKGFLAKCDITCMRLKDNARFHDYFEEYEYLSSNVERFEFMSVIVKNITDTTGNSIVLVNRIETGETLERELTKLGSDAIFLNGSVSSKKRFEEYSKVNDSNGKIIIATAQIASTGLNIPRLFNIFFIDFGKSFTKTIQSIGRVLRKAKDKDYASVYDICSTTKFAKKHFNERIHYYEDKKFPYKVLDIDNWFKEV